MVWFMFFQQKVNDLEMRVGFFTCFQVLLPPWRVFPSYFHPSSTAPPVSTHLEVSFSSQPTLRDTDLEPRIKMITSLNPIFDIIFGAAVQDVYRIPKRTARKTSSFLNSNLWLVLVHLFEISQLDKSLNSKGWILKFHCPQRMSSFTLADNCLGLKRTREGITSTLQHRWRPWDNISSSLCQYTLNKIQLP